MSRYNGKDTAIDENNREYYKTTYYITPPESINDLYFLSQDGDRLDSKGNIEASDSLFKTSKNKIFSAGDARRGQSLVVWAIREGRDCAASINNFLLK